jgi:Domain of unknown function (DUF4388)
MQADRSKADFSADSVALGTNEATGFPAFADRSFEGVPEDQDSGRGVDDGESDRGRFSGTCETTLIDWIQLVQMGRRDAVVSVGTYDGKEGTLWCRDGDIIDAYCDGVFGEEAVFRALSWKGGSVSVDFGPVKKLRQIQTATAGLLLRAAYRRDSGIHELENLVVIAESDDAQRTFDFGADTMEVVAPTQFFAPHEREQPQPEPALIEPAGRQSLSLRFAVAGAVSVFLVFSALAWQWMSAASPPSLATATPVRARVVSASERRAAVLAVPAATAAGSIRRSASVQPGASNGALARQHAAAVVPVRRSSVASPRSTVSSRVSDGPKASAPIKGKAEIIKSAAEPRQPRVQIIDGPSEQPRPRIQIIEDHKPHIQPVE